MKSEKELIKKKKSESATGINGRPHGVREAMSLISVGDSDFFLCPTLLTREKYRIFIKHQKSC